MDLRLWQSVSRAEDSQGTSNHSKSSRSFWAVCVANRCFRSIGLGAILRQKDDDGNEHPVAYYASQKLLPREVNYATIEKECLAIVWALRLFYTYLYGQSFTIEMDHQPLSWLHRMKNTNSRLIHWALALQPFNFSLKHRKGVDNANADGLSRGSIPTLEIPKKDFDGTNPPLLSQGGRNVEDYHKWTFAACLYVCCAILY